MPTIAMPTIIGSFWADPIPLVTAWIIGGTLAVFVPVAQTISKKQEFYNSYGYYNEKDDDQGNSNDEEEYYQQQNSCTWWSRTFSGCTEYYQANSRDDQVDLPSWYSLFNGVNEEESRDQDEDNMFLNTKTINFVYAWSLIIFVAIVAGGAFSLYKKQPSSKIIIPTVLVCLLQFSWLSTLLVTQGVIQTEGREIEDTLYGWYGQTGVLLALTNIAIIWFSVVFLVVFLARYFLERRTSGDKEENVEPTEYKNADML